MRVALCPGSFDPVTNGHVDVIERAAKLFDKVIVVVLVNKGKNPIFTAEQRVEFLKKSLAHLDNVEVDVDSGLLANYAKEKNAVAIVKGLRAVTDFEYEFQMALTNKKLNENVETLFLTTNMEYMFLSSSVVREVASFGGDISQFVPNAIREDIQKYFRKAVDDNGSR
ncbi:MAG: pantetheine-phosphate adenylyltransferase [Oscillospiraceae bacterium]|nr:pantetheine-phosphate adenylyltransferase [Oscillospiraceae bacterium]